VCQAIPAAYPKRLTTADPAIGRCQLDFQVQLRQHDVLAEFVLAVDFYPIRFESIRPAVMAVTDASSYEGAPWTTREPPDNDLTSSLRDLDHSDGRSSPIALAVTST
jgi:hypothetical protein